MNPVSNGYFWELPSGSWLTDTDKEVNGDGSDNGDWSRPPQINAMGLEWFYEENDGNSNGLEMGMCKKNT